MSSSTMHRSGEDMQEPTPCEECGDLMELQELYHCMGCHRLMCKDCKEPLWGGYYCPGCVSENELRRQYE